MRFAVLLLLMSAEPATRREAWDFDGERAHVQAHGEAKDDLTRLALSQLHVKLDGDVFFKVSAHPNSVGGVTLTFSDYNDESSRCDLYATRKGELLELKDGRCSFSAFEGQARTTATCRRIAGTVRRLKRGVAIDAVSPDCTAQPLGFSLEGSAKVKPIDDEAAK